MTKNYEPFLTDKASMYKLDDASLRNDYFKVWLSQGLKHPKSYIDAFAALESGWFAISKSPTGLLLILTRLVNLSIVQTIP